MAKTYIGRNEYRRFSDSDKLVHRWVAEEESGRLLRSGEEVHHKHRDRSDNSSQNLKVYKGRCGFIRHAMYHEADKAY